jgi:hypothetical protein
METDRGRRISEAKQRHGQARRGRMSSEYKAWAAMHRRCRNPNQQNYEQYGARGVAVADTWSGRGGFERFLAEIGPKPSPLHSVDRVDGTRGYEPGNVRWATAAEQAVNRSNTRWIEANGERLHVAEWARRLGTSPQNIFTRINRYGWTEERAVTEPVRPMPKRT